MQTPDLPRLPRSLRLALIAVATLAVSAACSIQFGTGIQARDNWTHTYTVKPGAVLEVRETNGRIHVVAGEGDQIEVTATRVTKAPTDEAAKAMLKEFTIEETASADRVELDGTARGISFGFNRSRHVDYDIKVPRSTSVTIKTTTGEVDLQGIGGFLRVEAVNGTISGAGLGDGADVSSVNGRIVLEFATLGDTGVRCKTTNGEIVVTIPRASKATLAGRVANGDIRTENLTIQPTEQSSRRLNGTIGGGGPEIRLETINGEVRIVGK